MEESKMLRYSTFQSPIGLITIAADPTHLRELHVEGDRYFPTVPKDWVYEPQHVVLQQTCKELTEYFNGRRSSFSVPITYTGTEFQVAVWKQVQNIPFVKQLSYGQLAAHIGRPDAIRAVGTAVGRNPICIIVPCHRVLAGDGSLGGYVAGLERKRYLLEREDKWEEQHSHNADR